MPSRQKNILENPNRMPQEVINIFEEQSLHKHSELMKLLRAEVRANGKIRKNTGEGNKDIDFSLTRAMLAGRVPANFDQRLAATRILGITRNDGKTYYNVGKQLDLGNECGYIEPSIRKVMQETVNNLNPDG